jgi:hypothetical protein
LVKFCMKFLFTHDEIGDIKGLLATLVTPPNCKKAVTFEAWFLASIRRQQRFSNTTVMKCLKLAAIYTANQTLDDDARVSLDGIMPDLHTKRQDELELLGSLFYASQTSSITSFNYFFNAAGNRRPFDETTAALNLHRGMIDEQESTAESLRSDGQAFYDMEMETQVRLTTLFLYMALAPANAMDILNAWVNSEDPKICFLLSNNAQGFFRYLVAMHISNPVVAAKPQWWTGVEHKTAICGCISSCETAPAPKIEALTKALLTHLAPMRALASADSDGDVDAGEPAEGQLDAEDDDVEMPT